MKKAYLFFTIQLLLFSIMLSNTDNPTSTANAQTNSQATPKPPVAKKNPKTFNTHGDERVDNYFWLREKSNPEVIAYLEAENAYTDALTKPTEALQASLYKEMIGRIKETDQTVPYHLGDYFYYSRTEQGKQYPIYCRKRDASTDAKEETTLDLNELAKGHKFLGLGAYAISDDGHFLAYTTDTTGFRQYTLQVKDLRTNKLLPEKVERVDAVMWARDNRTIFYVTEDPVTKRSNKFFRHVLGTDKHDLVYEEKDELYDLNAERSRDKQFIFVTSASKTTSEVRFFPTSDPNAALRVVHPRQNDLEYYLDHRGDSFYIRTNDHAKNFRVMTVPVSDPRKDNWKEFVAHNPKIKLDDIDLFSNYCVVSERENGLQYARVIDLQNNKAQRIEFSEPVYALAGEANPEFNTNKFRFRYQSLVTPPSVYDYNMETHAQNLLKQTEIPNYDPTKYTSERLFATAQDGTRVPISVVYKKGTKRDGRNPTLLYGYGSYGISIPDAFNGSRLSLLDRGFVYAIAHIRGGGEMGEEWRDAGKMNNKRNTFTDFIASAEHLIKEKYTSKDRLVIQGGSAGGLLMGAVTNMRPDLFKLVITQVPFVDVLNTMLDASLPLTVGEYLEWGNPNEKASYDYMKTYSPYDNIEAKAYPTMLVKTSLNDSQVMYWEPAKYVAKLRATKTDTHPLLFKINMGAGHGGASGRYDALKETAFDDAFILNQFGIAQ